MIMWALLIIAIIAIVNYYKNITLRTVQNSTLTFYSTVPLYAFI